MQDTLLVELFTEELPPKALKRLGDAFAEGIFEALKRERFTTAQSKLTVFATPRRLGASITHVVSESSPQPVTTQLMPVDIAFNADGTAKPALDKKILALTGYANYAEVPSNELSRQLIKGKEFLFHNVLAAGRTILLGLQEALGESISNLPVSKMMSYQLADGDTTVQFVRPAHGLVAMHGSKLLELTDVLGLEASKVTHGHRFQGEQNIALANADEYEPTLLERGAVIASFDKRKEEIERELIETAQLHGATLGSREDYAALLDEVTALVERPTVYVGAFETEFLAVPAECLILTMKLNQKYFPLFDRGGKLTNQFLIVSNMRLDNPHNIVEGNQRVVRPRLSDARFFFETDKKTPLEARVPKLANVVYHNKLGNQFERMQRVQKLAGEIALMIGANKANAERGAYLAKADLLTDMVGEFPELQGTMGRYYAMHDREAADVADAIEQHYWPKGSGGALPHAGTATAVMLADKLETLAGLFGIGQQPTGDKDPFALRRHALGVLRVLIEGQLSVTLQQLLAAACAVFTGVSGVSSAANAQADIETFVYERLRGYLREQGYTALEVESVLALRPSRLDQLPSQLAAVREFMALPEAESLAAANKRIGNILKKSEAASTAIAESLLIEPAERALFDALKVSAPKFDSAFHAQNYTAALKSLAVLKTPVDAFFDGVMVNAEDAKLRNNRLALLNDLHQLMNKVADLSKLAA